MFSGLANLVLICIMSGAVYTHMQLGEPVMLTPSPPSSSSLFVAIFLVAFSWMLWTAVRTA
jgi:hypothetical protein